LATVLLRKLLDRQAFLEKGAFDLAPQWEMHDDQPSRFSKHGVT
jgi:hypothetical protein